MNRTTLAALFLAATLPGMAMAMHGEDGPGKQEHSGMQGERHHKGPMFEELDLSKEQQQQMRKLKAEEMKTQREITHRYLDKLPEAERQAMRKDIEDSHEKNRKAMRDLLKPEQQKQFDEMSKKMQEKRQEREEFMKWKAEHGSKQ